MNILFITPRLPLPADTGAKIRTYNLLKNTAKNNRVVLLSLVFEDNQEAIKKLKELGVEVYSIKGNGAINLKCLFAKRPLSIQKYHSSDLKNLLKEIISNNKFDLIHFDHLHMGQYIDAVNGTPCVLDEHNVESIILKRCAQVEKNFIKKLLFNWQARKMAQFESRVVRKFSRCLVVSEKDKENLLKLAEGKVRVEVIPNGVDTDYFSLTSLRVCELTSLRVCEFASCEEEDALVFTGSMDWLPNNDAVIYFCNEILPLIWQKNQAVKFYIVGKNPSEEIKRIAKKDSRIIVTGDVSDVRPYIARAKVFVVPMRIGGGTRLKILEAMAMERAVISTSLGAEGINYTQDKNIIIQDPPGLFAESIIMLLENQEKRQELGREGRNLVKIQYDWSIIANKLQSIYQGILN